MVHLSKLPCSELHHVHYDCLVTRISCAGHRIL